jgi:hypothetical protein
MITVCSVILQEIEPYLPIFEESISTRTKFVSEVLIASPDRHTTYSQIYEKNNIKFHRFGTMEHDRFQQGIEHGIGLHACIEKSKN